MARAPIIINHAQLAGSGGLEGVVNTDLSAGDGVDPAQMAAMQATLNFALSKLEREQVDPEVLTAPDDKIASLLQSAIAESADQNQMQELASGGLEFTFDRNDRTWLFSLFGLIKDKLNVGRFDFLPQPDSPVLLPNKSRLAVLGDWGTGLYGAPKCAESIKADPDGFESVVHLGDVYYSGSAEEVEERFLAFWPSVPGAINRACNSNHEMYSGGKPYAEITLPKFDQSSSLWWLENDHWVLLGLDTAYDEADIGPMQAGWLQMITAQARRDGKRVIFFSHHQLFSPFKPPPSDLADKLRGVLEDQRVFAWYWGHEHLCALFDPHPRFGTLGRCVGHSGFPYPRPKLSGAPIDESAAGGMNFHRLDGRGEAPSGLVLDGPNDEMPGKKDRFGPNGYAVLELEDDHLTEAVMSCNGEVLHRRQLA